MINEKCGNSYCRVYKEFRELLKKENIDTAILALPDHWHALNSVAVANKRIDIYGEKPLARSIAGGRAIVDAANRNNIIWQIRSWQRPVPHFRQAAELVRNGRIGKVEYAEVGLPDGGHYIGKIFKNSLKTTLLLLMLILSACTTDKNTIIVNDDTGVLSKTNTPVSVKVKLSELKWNAAHENRLALAEVLEDKMGPEFPVQLKNYTEGELSELMMIMPNGEPGMRKFKLIIKKSPFANIVKAGVIDKNEQVLVQEGENKVLQYNYQTVFEKDVVRANKEKTEEYTRNERDTFIVTSIYAVPRSNYIHPLYGLEGEMLTRDWPDGGHPHHRGIFWAWPEVYYGSELGDIYALQRLFARPTGNIELTNGPVYAQINAENIWMWEDKEPIVNEKVAIRVYRSSEKSRVIDLKIKLLALKDSIAIATRYTDSYGGLNIRMQFPEMQNISYFTDNENSNPVRAWSDFSGIFEGVDKRTGLMVLQNQKNPEYPGEWVEYPDLAWVQPTFPSPGTRYKLSKQEPLILQYRLIVHTGGVPAKDNAIKIWNAYHNNLTPTM